MVKLIAASVFNRPDFIPIQLNSIKKHIKCDFEYVVFDNAKIEKNKNGENYSKEINGICKELNVECVEVPIDQRILDLCKTGTINSGGYSNGAYACYYPIQWCFVEYLKNTDDIVYIIDSDLFFINDINLQDLLKDKDCMYIPQYRHDNKSAPIVEYMWNMFCGFNFKRNPGLKTLNWSNGSNNGQFCDVGGGTHMFLDSYKPDIEYIEEFNVYEINKLDNDLIHINININGNIAYDLIVNSKFELKEIKRAGGVKFCDNKSFFYEKDRVKYEDYILDFAQSLIYKIKSTNLQALPQPLRLGFIKRAVNDYIFALHYRSASNYLDFSTKDYNDKKTELLLKLIS